MHLLNSLRWKLKVITLKDGEIFVHQEISLKVTLVILLVVAKMLISLEIDVSW